METVTEPITSKWVEGGTEPPPGSVDLNAVKVLPTRVNFSHSPSSAEPPGMYVVFAPAEERYCIPASPAGLRNAIALGELASRVARAINPAFAQGFVLSKWPAFTTAVKSPVMGM